MLHNHSFAHADAPRRHGKPSHQSDHLRPPMPSGAKERLSAWFAGNIALTRAEAHRLLASAVESGHIADHHAEFVAAIKALAVHPANWPEMGYRLLPDD